MSALKGTCSWALVLLMLAVVFPPSTSEAPDNETICSSEHDCSTGQFCSWRRLSQGICKICFDCATLHRISFGGCSHSERECQDCESGFIQLNGHCHEGEVEKLQLSQEIETDRTDAGRMTTDGWIQQLILAIAVFLCFGSMLTFALILLNKLRLWWKESSRMRFNQRRSSISESVETGSLKTSTDGSLNSLPFFTQNRVQPSRRLSFFLSVQGFRPRTLISRLQQVAPFSPVIALGSNANDPLNLELPQNQLIGNIERAQVNQEHGNDDAVVPQVPLQGASGNQHIDNPNRFRPPVPARNLVDLPNEPESLQAPVPRLANTNRRPASATDSRSDQVVPQNPNIQNISIDLALAPDEVQDREAIEILSATVVELNNTQEPEQQGSR